MPHAMQAETLLAAPITWRAFGCPGDLDLDFRGADRPVLVSRLLAVCRADGGNDCGTGAALDQAWSLSLGARIGALAEILARTQDGDGLAVQLACPRCAEGFEVILSLAALGELGREAMAPRVELRLDDGRPLVLRRPTGADQRRWLADPDLGEAQVLADLLQEGAPVDPSPQWLARVAEAMAEADLLPAFAVHSTCPHCGQAGDLPLDLEGELLARLAGQARRLTRAVHRLASRYGWREADILALPGHRRAAYLDLLDQEAGSP